MAQSPISESGDRKAEKNPRDDEGLLAMMRERFARSETFHKSNRQRFIQDTEMLATSDQWPADVKAGRESAGRPALTFNMLPKFFFQVSNEIKQNMPGFSVKPEGDRSGTDDALVLEGLLRHINNRSMGDECRENACDTALSGGWGYYGVTTQYLHDNPEGFDEDEEVSEEGESAGLASNEDAEASAFMQEIRIRHIENALSVHDDPAAKLPDRSDRRFLFIEENIPLGEFKEQYPNATPESWAPDKGVETHGSGWADDKNVRVVEYWYIDESYRQIKSRDGKRSRRLATRQVKWMIASKAEILESGDWLGHWIPFLYVGGWTVNINGERRVEGLLHQAMDPQRAYNYMRTAQAERIGLGALSPWLMVAGQDKGFEDDWANSNKLPKASLKYSTVALKDNTAAPPPTRLDPPPASGDILSGAEAAKADLHDTVGMSPPAVGQESMQRTLGQDKLSRLESDVSNYHFIRSLKTAMAFEGRIIADLIPRIYDTKRIGRIIGDDGVAEMVSFNPDRAEGSTPRAVTTYNDQDDEGQPVPKKHYDLGVGKYDITIKAGPSFTSRQDQAVSGMLDMMKIGGPAISPILLPFFAKEAQWRDHEIISELAKAMLPDNLQQILSQSGAGDPKQEASQLRAQVAQMMPQMEEMAQMLQTLQTQVQDKQAQLQLNRMEINLREQTKRMETIGRVRIQHMKSETDLMKVAMGLGQPVDTAAASNELDVIADEGSPPAPEDDLMEPIDTTAPMNQIDQMDMNAPPAGMGGPTINPNKV